jgi:predicted RNA-binding protein associated with RNAse of E/G family
MPRIDKIFTLEITPEQFLKACSAAELIELDLLLQSPRFQRKMINHCEVVNGKALPGAKAELPPAGNG